jgi:hypothetical protein
MLSLVLRLFFVPFVDWLAIDRAETRIPAQISNCFAVQVGQTTAFRRYQRGVMMAKGRKPSAGERRA